MAKPISTANWQTLDVATLPSTIASLYHDYKQAYAEMKAARNEFEDKLRSSMTIPQGKRLVFGYNFGKLSVALVDDDAKPAKTSGSLSLSAFLASQSVQGKRT